MSDSESHPLPPGYVMRSPQLDDLEACRALINRCADVKAGAGRTTISEIEAEWSTPGVTLDENFRLTGATRLYERAGMQVVSVSEIYEKVLRPGIVFSNQG